MAIDGATSSTYELTAEDVGDTFTVQVWSSDQHGNGNGNANTDAADSIGGENNNGQTLTQTRRQQSAIVYDQAKPFIIVGALDASGDDMRIEPGVDSHPRIRRECPQLCANGEGNLISEIDGMEMHGTGLGQSE